MIFFRSNGKHQTKLKSYKKDFAPMGFYFDIFATDLFLIPILPIPMRIDKLSNGEPTLLITPNRDKLERVSKRLNLTVNFHRFYEMGITNFLKYADLKQKELTLRGLNGDKIRKWWHTSNLFSAFNPDLEESFTFITSQFLKMYSYIDKNNLDPTRDKDQYNNSLIKYCDSVVKYFRNKIEKNYFVIKNGKAFEMEKLYLEKKNKYYPLALKLTVTNLITNKTSQMGFVPYLIYDDILDSFYYNTRLLKNTTNHTINLKVYEDNQIINKTSNIDDIRTKSSKIELKNLNLNEILHRLKIIRV